jgi:hypothetical protein
LGDNDGNLSHVLMWRCLSPSPCQLLHVLVLEKG